MGQLRDVLLEIGLEEVPARALGPLLSAMEERARQLLTAARLPFGDVQALGTPRRLVLHIHQVARQQDAAEQAVRGPSRQVAYTEQGEPTRQAQGFARGQGVEVDALEVRPTPGGDYVFAVKREMGLPTMDLLPTLFSELIAQLPSTRPMRWGEGEFRFIRPIRWLLALYGPEPVSFSMAGISAQPLTYGHRTINPGPHAVGDTIEYFKGLPDWGIILSGEQRKQIITEQVMALANSAGGTPLIEPALLTEVAGLVEYPTAFIGHFDQRYLRLPDEVLVTTLRHHQRVFPVRGASGLLLPVFIGVRNGDKWHLPVVMAGNERVISARLADAEFFFEQDGKLPLGKRLEELKRVVFMEGSGTLYDKVNRVGELSRVLSLMAGVREGLLATVSRSALLCKADLVTNLVREFPELQGVMGREYALLAGEPREVAQAIYEHYLPRTAEDEMPNSMAGVMVGLADRMDTLSSCFARGMQPTGSQDPYGLRRQALGVVQLLWHAELPLDLSDVVRRAFNPLFDGDDPERPHLEEQLLSFIRNRARTLFADAGMSLEITDAVFAAGLREVVDGWRRCRALAEFAQRQDFAQLLIAYKRVANLASGGGGEVDKRHLRESAEHDLHSVVEKAQRDVAVALDKRDYSGYLRLLLALKPSIDRFFEDVMVLSEEEALRTNRLALLAMTQRLFEGMTAFDGLSPDLGRKVSAQ